MTAGYQRGNRLAGKVALVTGAAQPLGECHVRAMVAQGARVVVADSDDAAAKALSQGLGAAAHAVHLNVTDREQWAAAVAEALDRFSKLDVLVNSAAVDGRGRIEDHTGERWDHVIAGNLTAVFNGVQACLEALAAAAPSSIVNVASTAGLRGYPALVSDTAAKWGVTGLTKALALDLGARGIRCNSVHPGIGADATQIPLKRAGDPAEVSNLVVFLAGDESSFCTGASFVADGGEHASTFRRETGKG